MASLGTLAVNIVARTSKFSAGVTKSLGLTGKFTRGIGTAAIATTAFAASTVAAGATVVRTYEGINSSMQKSLAIMSGVSDAQRSKMIETALAVAGTTQKSTAQAAESYYFLASAGMDAAQAMKAMPVVAKFAQAGNFDLALATDLATDAQSALGLSSKNAAVGVKNLTRVTNVLIKANTLANASAQQFSEAVTNGAGAAMRTANISMEEGVSVLAAFADQGMKGAEAGTAFGIVLRDLQTKALQNQAAFAVAGVSVFKASGEMQKMADIVGNLERLLGPLSVAQRKSTLMAMGFSDKSVKYLQTLVGTSEKIRDYEQGLKGSNAASEVAAKSMTDLQKGAAQMGKAWDSLALKIGTAAEKLGAFSGAAEFLEGVGIILDRVDRAASGQGNKSQNYRENLDKGQYQYTALGLLQKAVYDTVLGDVKGTGPISADHNARYGGMRSPEQQSKLDATLAAEEKAARVAAASGSVEKTLKAGFDVIVAKALSGAAQATGAMNAAAKKAAGAEKAVQRAMLSDALHSITFGALGKKSGRATAVAESAVGGPKQDLVARRAGTIDAYAAARRNIDKPMQTQIDIARKQLKEQSETRRLLARDKPTIITIGGTA